MSWLEQLGVEHRVVQAGMGGGISRARLAAAVSDAGGLGTIGTLPPAALRAETRRIMACIEDLVAESRAAVDRELGG